MKRSELKAIIKECVRETLLEEGLLSNIVSEVVRGFSPLLTENKTYHFSENFQFYNDDLIANEIMPSTDGLFGTEDDTINWGNTYYEGHDPINPVYGLAYNNHNYEFRFVL